MGAQLRRAGEVSLREDVTKTLLSWREHIESAAIIFVSCPKTMRRGLHESREVSRFMPREDERVRNVPLIVGRPSFESACAVNEVMLRLRVKDLTEDENNLSAKIPPVQIKENASVPSELTASTEKKDEKRHEKEEEVVPLTPLHNASAAADLAKLFELLEVCCNDDHEQNAMWDVDERSGKNEMTPLHYAASSADPSKAADCVSALLLIGHANPCVLDSHGRPPFFVACHDKIRDAFRIARSKLGEETWDWDQGKVGPPLSIDALRERKDKAAEKKRKQRARQKEKKAREKAKAEDSERKTKEAEEQKKREEDAKRKRAGLKPKTSSAENICDFCQKVCKGKRRSQMFSRLEYIYCSTDCVKKHQRELSAAAAMARLGA